MNYKTISDYIKKTMEERRKTGKLHGDFLISATDFSEKGDGCVLVMIHPHGEDGDTADFVIYPDGKEEMY